jgi:hypothetical protein
LLVKKTEAISEGWKWPLRAACGGEEERERKQGEKRNQGEKISGFSRCL